MKSTLAAACAMYASSVLAAHATGIGIEWLSKDESLLTVDLGPGAGFKWTNPDGSSIELTGGLLGATMKLQDKKEKRGSITVSPPLLTDLADPSYGTSGEPGIPLAGNVTDGEGEFILSMEGFEEIADFEASFSADLVGAPDINPFEIVAYGQGDQLADGKSGLVSYLTRWSSLDVFPLLDAGGAQYASLEIGDFLLASSGMMDAFDFSVGSFSNGSPAFEASFTSDQMYTLVYDATAADGSGSTPSDNIRESGLDGVFGTVSKDVAAVPLPITLPIYAFMLGFLGLAGARGGSRRSVNA